MAAPVGGLSSTLSRISPRLSETVLSSSTNPLLQVASATRASRILRRPKTANPGGWSRRRSRDSSRKIPLDIRNADTPPSSVYLRNMKNGLLDQNYMMTMLNDENKLRINLYNKLDYLSKKSPKVKTRSSGISSPQSLEKISVANFSGTNRSNKEADRENEIFEDTDYRPVDWKNAENTENIYENIDMVKLSDLKSENNDEKDARENILNMTAAQKITNAETSPGKEKMDWSTSLQRTVDINLNDFDPAKRESKKTLSMDINVVVSVKPQDAAQKAEIGFQENPHQMERNENKLEKTTSHKLKVEKLNDSRLKPVLSQKDLTEEIGKVYNFLKNNEQLELSSENKNPSSFDIYHNFHKIKSLYINALRFIKSFRELRYSTSNREVNEDKNITEHSLVNEFDKCCNRCSGSNTLLNVFKYPIDFSKTTYTINHCNEGHTTMGFRKQLLASQQPNVMTVRMYAKGSDCEKAKKLPCLLSSEVSKGDHAAKASAKTVCEKLCMPCCKPARDPPVCYYPYHKAPCKKEKPPRPAYSECKQMFEMRQVAPCECVRPRATTCKPSAASEKCTK